MSGAGHRAGLEAQVVAQAGSRRLDVYLRVARGETLALLGPNGAGKTTLLRVLAGLHPLEAGRVEHGGQVLADTDDGVDLEPEARSVGFVFQDGLLFPHLDAVGNVAFGLRARGHHRRDARARAAEWLGRLGLGDRLRAQPDQLSGGEAQRVALARALASEPEILLLDEPLAALDAEVRAGLRRQLRSHLQAHGGPTIVVTHDLVDAAMLADRLLVIEDGVVTADGRLDELVARPRTPWGAQLAGTNLLRATASGVHLALPTGGILHAAERAGASEVLVAVRPAAVSLHLQEPSGSPRNVWPARVVDLEGLGERRRVRLDGPVPLVAEVTAAAVMELALGPGREVWASVKATDIAVYPA